MSSDNTPKRINVFTREGKLIGQNYQRDNMEWMHKWIDGRTGQFERGSWSGKCEGETSEKWTYKQIDNL